MGSPSASRTAKISSLTAATFVLIGFLTGCQASPGSTVRDFFKDLEQGEINRASESFSSQTNELYGNKLQVGMREVPAQLEAKKGIKKIKILDESVKGDLAKVAYQIEFGDGSTEEGTLDLIKEEGKWKITPMAK